MKKERVRKAWIPGYTNLYKSSTAGEILSFHKNPRGKPIKLRERDDGSIVGLLFDGRGGREELSAKHLIAKVFLPKPTPAHKKLVELDGDRRHIKLLNLKWMTPKQKGEFVAKRRRKNGIVINWATPGAKLDKYQASIVKRLAIEHVSYPEISKMFGISTTQISRIKMGTKWKDVDTISKEELIEMEIFNRYLL